MDEFKWKIIEKRLIAEEENLTAKELLKFTKELKKLNIEQHRRKYYLKLIQMSIASGSSDSEEEKDIIELFDLVSQQLSTYTPTRRNIR